VTEEPAPPNSQRVGNLEPEREQPEVVEVEGAFGVFTMTEDGEPVYVPVTLPD
jgi:hypothetical protein